MKSWSVDQKLNAEKIKVAIVLPYFNEDMGLELLKNVENELKKAKVKTIAIKRVFGALEIPYACMKVASKFDVIIALGIVIKGKSKHFDLVVETCYKGIMDTQLVIKTPIIFGVLTCDNLKQAKERISAKHLNKGKEFAQAAIIQTLI